MSGPPAAQYRVEYLIAGADRTADEVRSELGARLACERPGGTIAVAGDDTIIKVHVTTARPEVALAIGRAAGTLADVIVEAQRRLPPRSGGPTQVARDSAVGAT